MLLWGRGWKVNFAREAHPETEFYAVGSPYFDHLQTVARGFDDRVYDVLIIGGSHASDPQEALPWTYEAVVTEALLVAESLNYNVAIKLHHNEPIEWYEARGLDQYVVEFTDIVDAVGDSKVVVNVKSSAFVEAVAMGVPVIVDESWRTYYEKMNAEAGVDLLDFEELEETLPLYVEGGRRRGALSDGSAEFLRIGESMDRIANIVEGDDAISSQ